MIMEEIEPDYFKELSFNILPKNESKSVLNDFDLKKIYRHMVLQMELWFLQNDGDKEVKNSFRKDMVDLKKLVEVQDINELLIILEFVMIIVAKGSRS